MRIHLPEVITSWLAPTGYKEPKWRKILRRIACSIEGHGTASWDDPKTDVLTCDWCGASWIKKRPAIIKATYFVQLTKEDILAIERGDPVEKRAVCDELVDGTIEETWVDLKFQKI